MPYFDLDEQQQTPESEAEARRKVLGMIAGSAKKSVLGAQPADQPTNDELIRRAGGMNSEAFRPGSNAYNLSVGATSQPRIPPSRITPVEPPAIGGPPAPSARPLLGQPARPARPNVAPTREDFPTRPTTTWQKVLGVAAAPFMPGVTDLLLNRPRREAEQQYKTASQEWERGQSDQMRQAQIENIQSEVRTRNQRPQPPDKAEAKTVQVGDKVMQWNPDTNRYDIEVGAGRTKPAKHSPGEVKFDEGIPTGVYGDQDKLWRANDPAMPPELKAALGDAQGAHKQKFGEQQQIAREGRAVLAGSKAVNMITADGRLQAVNGEDLPRFMRENPGAVEAGAGAGTQAMGKQALINDIRESAKNVGKNLAVLDRQGFDRAKLASALADPNTTVGAYLQAIPRGSLDEQGQQFVSDLFNLREQAMAMRSVLGAGQGSEDMRRAILQTLPGVGSGSSGFGKKQLDNLIAVLGRLERGVPQTPMRPQTGGAATGGGFKPF